MSSHTSVSRCLFSLKRHSCNFSIWKKENALELISSLESCLIEHMLLKNLSNSERRAWPKQFLLSDKCWSEVHISKLLLVKQWMQWTRQHSSKCNSRNTGIWRMDFKSSLAVRISLKAMPDILSEVKWAKFEDEMIGWMSNSDPGLGEDSSSESKVMSGDCESTLLKVLRLKLWSTKSLLQPALFKVASNSRKCVGSKPQSLTS